MKRLKSNKVIHLIIICTVCVIAIITYALYKTVCYEKFMPKQMDLSQSVAILLTACQSPKNAVYNSTLTVMPTIQRNPYARTVIYRDRINKWLNNTTLPIFVVDSSGYPFNEFKNTRLKTIPFELDATGTQSKLEALSIIHALEHSPELRAYPVIIKVTCKYFIKDLETYLQQTPLTTDLYLQNTYSDSDRSQHTEVFGFRSHMYQDIFNSILHGVENAQDMESAVHNLSQRLSYTRFPAFSLDDTFYRGDGTVLNQL